MQQRSSFLKHSALGLGALPVLNLLGSTAWAAGEVELTENDPMAVALGYKHVAEEGGNAGVPRTENSFCDNCAQYVATQDGWGTCNIFPGKLVAAKGWCNVWVAMPAS